jgi:hypothetical protein
MATLLETVDANGNIWFGMGEGLDIRILERDDAGTEIDISSLARFFSIQGGFRIELVDDPDNPLGRRILIEDGDLNFIKSTAQFSYTDNSGVVAITLWEGFIRRRLS